MGSFCQNEFVFLGRMGSFCKKACFEQEKTERTEDELPQESASTVAKAMADKKITKEGIFVVRSSLFTISSAIVLTTAEALAKAELRSAGFCVLCVLLWLQRSSSASINVCFMRMIIAWDSENLILPGGTIFGCFL